MIQIWANCAIVSSINRKIRGCSSIYSIADLWSSVLHLVCLHEYEFSILFTQNSRLFGEKKNLTKGGQLQINACFN